MRLHLFSSLLFAWCIASCSNLQAHLFIGPEISYVERLREGGTKQTGYTIGARMGYDHIKRFRLYYGVEGSYAYGPLTGKSGNGDKLKSNLTDFSIEGRLGYTFACKTGRKFSFTPFIGLGYFEEKNYFTHPSPLPIHYKITYDYVSTGFFTSFYLKSDLELGLRFKSRIMIEPESHISNDPKHESSTQAIRHKAQYRIELPLTYYRPLFPCAKPFLNHIIFSLVPFYEYRHYGRQSNFPFDFLETQFNIYGATFELQVYW